MALRPMARRIYNHIPRGGGTGPASAGGLPGLLRRVARPTLLWPSYFALAWLRGGPGLAMHLRFARLGLSLMLRGRRGLPPGTRRGMVFAPMDSVRYFELEFAWESARPLPASARYLDVSSPRLLPVTLLAHRPGWSADLLNPDARDLEATRALVAACGLSSRCALHPRTVDAAPLEEGAYDLASCISVVEHIPHPADEQALERIWRSIRPGGRLVLTVPCAREGFDEYVDLNEYGLLPADENGYVFGQRFYDERALEQSVFRILGRPARLEILGERREGLALVNRAAKVMGEYDPGREAYMMATDFRRYGSLAELPGWGVVAMEFRKAPGS